MTYPNAVVKVHYTVALHGRFHTRFGCVKPNAYFWLLFVPIHIIYNASMEETDVISLYEMCLKNAITIWIDGGWGVDALLGYQTRPHEDLDIAIQEKDVSKLRELLQEKGYQEIKLDIARPHNFVLGDEKGHEIDIHVIILDAQGNGIYGPADNGEMYPADSLTGMGIIAGRDVRCISPEWMVKFHSGYEPREKDVRDVLALCERFGIQLPEVYLEFQ